MSDLDIIETELLSINAIINRSISKGVVVHNGKGSICSDEEVAHLPIISSDHPHYNEWKLREHSTKRLLKQLQKLGSSLNILVVGSGNRWLAAKLSNITSGEVMGIDINLREPLQAKPVIGSLRNPEFVATDISDGQFPDKQFDIIVFSASIQNFSSLKDLIKAAMEHLTLMGQIHILDSPLLTAKNIPAQKPQAPDHYIHCVNELESFQYKMIYDPNAWNNKLFAKRDPFVHIVIKNHYH